MTSREDEVRAQIDDLSELIAAVRIGLAGLNHNAHPTAIFRRSNLEATLETVQRELDRAMKTLDLLPGQEVTGEGLAKIKTQIREARPSAKTVQSRAQGRQAPEHSFDKAAAEAILSSATSKAKKRKGR